jgi:hypothetical protein
MSPSGTSRGGFTREIGRALTTLGAERAVRIIDLRVISKADDCTLTSVEIGGLDARLQPQFSQVTVALSEDSIRQHCGAKPPPTHTS